MAGASETGMTLIDIMIYTTCIVAASPIQLTFVAFLARVNGIPHTPPFLEHRMWDEINIAPQFDYNFIPCTRLTSRIKAILFKIDQIILLYLYHCSLKISYKITRDPYGHVHKIIYFYVLITIYRQHKQLNLSNFSY